MDVIEEQLTNSKTIAVVGLSPNPERPSHYVAKYLQEHGYRIIPVNPLLPVLQPPGVGRGSGDGVPRPDTARRHPHVQA